MLMAASTLFTCGLIFGIHKLLLIKKSSTWTWDHLANKYLDNSINVKQSQISPGS